MRTVGQSIHRARLVQRAQSVRQRRIGGLLVSVRFQRGEVETKRQGFQTVLSTINAFQVMPVLGGGGDLRRRLHQVGVVAGDRLKAATHREDQLAVREGRLQHLLSVAERAVQRGVERERIAIHEVQRVRESIDIAELQGQETGAAEGIHEDEMDIGVAPLEQVTALSASMRGESPPVPLESGWLPGIAAPTQQGGTISSGEARRAHSPGARGFQSVPVNSPVAVSEVVIEAPLPQSAGSVEIVHSPAEGVSVRVSARGTGVAASLRRSCKAIRDSLHEERVRVSSVDVVEEDI